MRGIRYLIDVDGVIANFAQFYLDIVQEQFGRSYTEDSITEWDVGDSLGLNEAEKEIVHRDLYAPGVAYALKPYPKTLASIQDHITVGGGDVWFVTTSLRENPTWEFDRRRWIEKYFGPRQVRKIIFASQKHVVQGEVFIDDKLKNVVDWKEHNPDGLAVLWATPSNAISSYNKNLFFRTDKLEYVVSAAEDLFK